MYKFIALCISCLLLSSCAKENDKNISCSKPDIEVSVSSGSFSLYTYGESYGFIEAEYGPNGFSQGSGTTKTSSDQFSVNNMVNGTYDVYVRGNCGGNDWSDWAGPKSFIIEEGSSATCPKQEDLEFNSSGRNISISWYDYNSEANYYEIEYGISGFEIGNGTRGTSNNTYFQTTDYTGDNIYDFYVRANCGGEDWSSWSDVHSFYVPQYVCNPPSNLSAQRYSSSVIEYDFTAGSGNSSWEVVLLSSSVASPDSGFIKPVNSTGGAYTGVSSSTTYYFYARAVCSDGSKTDWVGPVQIN